MSIKFIFIKSLQIIHQNVIKVDRKRKGNIVFLHKDFPFNKDEDLPFNKDKYFTLFSFAVASFKSSS